jgi:hypothetical protein
MAYSEQPVNRVRAVLSDRDDVAETSAPKQSKRKAVRR